jgi:iron complex outermembrane receptor protein
MTKTFHALIAGSAAIWVMAAVPAAAQTALRFNIPAQPASDALNEWARQAGTQIVFPYNAVEGRRTPAVRASLAPREALNRLIANLGLIVTSDGGGVTTLSASGQSKGKASKRDAIQVSGEAKKTSSMGEATPGSAAANDESADIVVTGTNIPGVQPSSPVITIRQKEMRLAGFSNVGDVVRSIPQNFSGGQNPGVSGATGAFAGGLQNQDITGASSINLRGLGPDATLTLLNGTRLPYDGFSQATDVSVVPVAAIERIEILLDGASAIYGSDAVGGVANIILKRDYNGAEISARFGGATDGGYSQTQVTGVAGAKWGTGGFLVTGDISKSTAIDAQQRSYLRYLPEPNTIYPRLEQKGALLSAHQYLAPNVETMLDAFYTRRNSFSAFNQIDFIGEQPVETTVYGIVPSVRVTLPGDWSLKLQGFYGSDNSESVSRYLDPVSKVSFFEVEGCLCNKSHAVELGAEGRLFSLPGGDANIALGAGYRYASFKDIDRATNTITTQGSRHNYFAYGEITLPIFSPRNSIPALYSLTFNGAARYEHYSDFGDVVTPKVGVTWGVTPDFDIIASWGRSFKAPTLLQQFQSSTTYLFSASGLLGAPAGSTLLQTSGGNPNLGPERATTFATGVIAHPRFAPKLRLSVNYFHVDYNDRVVAPLPSSFVTALTDPAYANFIVRNPSPTLQQAAISVGDRFTNFTGRAYNPATVVAILYNQNVNASRQKVDGVDLSALYTIDLPGSSVTAGGNVTWLKSHRQLTSLAPYVPTAGVKFFPAGFRGRGQLSWSDSRLTISSFLNYVDGIRDSSLASSSKGRSMSTIDLTIDYQAKLSLLGEIGFNISAINLFDVKPPRTTPATAYYVNYDATNYSAIGRVINVTLTKRF